MITNFHISKEVYFKSILKGFNDNIKLLNAVKNDFPRMDVFINENQYKVYHLFLETIKKKYPNYLKKILLLTNQNAHFYYYNEIFNILSKHEYHFVSNNMENNDKKLLKTCFNLTPFIKQACLYNTYNVITVDKCNQKVHRTIMITTIIDLLILDPVLIKIEYIN